MPLSLRLPPEGALVPNNDVDPLPYYYRPVVGRIFAARLNTGLKLLDGRFDRILEIGYGSGLLMPTLAAACDELYGLDLEAEPVGLRDRLAKLGVAPKELVQADAQKMPFADRFFDGVVAFSIFEHLRGHELGPALAEVARVLRPGGKLLVGCPAVHPLMNAAFATIGFRDIENHHFSTIADVAAAAAPSFTVARRSALPSLMTPLPLGWAPYTTVLFERR
ncbi:MAG: type 11 methyltransferase [Myxococcales bacterium]|nr:type 11 methyltransferase [Myxococcales bacterium]